MCLQSEQTIIGLFAACISIVFLQHAKSFEGVSFVDVSSETSTELSDGFDDCSKTSISVSFSGMRRLRVVPMNENLALNLYVKPPTFFFSNKIGQLVSLERSFCGFKGIETI